MGITLLDTRLVALAALAWGSACGGNVVVDGMPDGSGGAGATSASAVAVGVTGTSGSWTTSAAVTSSSTGVGGGDARSMCVSYCELVADRCGIGPGGGCGGACDEQVGIAPACNDQLAPFFECAMRHVDACDVFPDRCQEHLDRYDECTRRPG
ncbi:hypothetical protein [Sorangium sp. So ce1335]|uniref:hypothetical protein n=1 Tax=Sorangium sp. So ce1335 TaxID=3133335 RepID=UPI003F624DBF